MKVRLFHISDDFDIDVFVPRPVRKEIWGELNDAVWSVDEHKLQNYLFPRNCPRVCWMIDENTSEEDIEYFRSFGSQKSLIFLQENYKDMFFNGKLMMYEFNTENFYLIDECAGYYISHHEEVPKFKVLVTDLMTWLNDMNVEIRFVENLKEYAEESVKRTFAFSNIRMGMLK